MIDENGLKTRNSGESGRFAEPTRQTEGGSHITNTGQTSENPRIRDIFTHGIRDMKFWRLERNNAGRDLRSTPGNDGSGTTEKHLYSSN